MCSASLAGENDPYTGNVVYTRSVAGEALQITKTLGSPTQLVSTVANGPDGPNSYTLGNGLSVAKRYDFMGRNSGQWLCNGSTSQYCTGGTQVYGQTQTVIGTQMQSVGDTVLNQSVAFDYDDFNRLISRTVTSGTVQNYTYNYDRYGNRLHQTPLQGGTTFAATVAAATNHLDGYLYDIAGNMVDDGPNTYTYDAEGNMLSVNGGGDGRYVYDALNRRTRTQTSASTVEYLYDYAGRRTSSWLNPTAGTTGTANEGRIYWDGQQIAFRGSDGATYFDHQDYLGTERMRTTAAGAVASTYQSLPWGDGYAANIINAVADQDNNHYTSLEQDNNALNAPMSEHAQYRNYSFTQGRWLAPDPYDGSYDITNPQSFNRYAYVLNNPLSFLDPTGLDAVCSIDQDTGNLMCTSHYQTCDTNPSLEGCGAPPPGCTYIFNPQGQWEGYSCGGAIVTTGGGGNGGGSGGGTAPSNNPPKNTGCSVLNPNCKTPGPVEKYAAFLGCYYNSFIGTITDEEDGQGGKTFGPTAFGFINAGAVFAIKYKLYNPAGLTFVATAAIMDTGAMVNANKNCTAQVYP